jgi:hypothetical protein
MKCHQKCCVYTTLGVFFAACFIVLVGWGAKCENLYGERDDICGQVNQLVCDICQQCTCTQVCTPHDLDLYCGVDCQNTKNDISEWECPDKNVNRGLIALFVLCGGIIGLFTVLYFLREAFQEITGTQDDV